MLKLRMCLGWWYIPRPGMAGQAAAGCHKAAQAFSEENAWRTAGGGAAAAL